MCSFGGDTPFFLNRGGIEGEYFQARQASHYLVVGDTSPPQLLASLPSIIRKQSG